MKLTLTRIGRFWQYVGVAMAAHVATLHATVLGLGPGGATEAHAVSSWTRVFIGICIAIILFWTGVYLEGRTQSGD